MEALYPVLFGLIATLAMSLLLYAIGQSGAQGAEWVKGIGSSIPTPAGGSQVPGAAIHVIAGIVFAYVYALLGRQFAFQVPGQMIALGVVVGLVKGIVASLVLGMLAFDQDPMGRVSQAGLGVGIVHAVGHAVYGLLVSVLFGISGVEYVLSYT